MQQMIHSAFFFLELLSKSPNNDIWYLDFGASNHMKNCTYNLTHVKYYDGALKIQTANGNSIKIKLSVTFPSPFLYIMCFILLTWLQIGFMLGN